MNEKNLHEDKIGQDEQSNQEKSNIVTLILSSILLHLLIMLVIIFYRLEHKEIVDIPQISPHDKVTLFADPSTATMPQQVMPEPKKETQKTQEPKKEEKQPEILRKLPKIIPGKQGLDKQDFTGESELPPATKPTEQKPEPVQSSNKIAPQESTVSHPTPKKSADQTNFEKKSQLIRPTADIIRQDPDMPKHSVSQELTPTKNLQKAAKKDDQPIQQPTSPERKKDIVFDTNFDVLTKKTLQEKLIEKNEKYEHIPSPQTTQKKTISYKDIGLGFSNSGVNIGNSAHLMMQGTSPDIPQGDELKYITYLNQMANMIVSAMHANSQLHLLPHVRGESIICFMKVTKEGQLLDVRIIRPSKYEVINIFIVESIRQVGLFNQLPKFINKDTFEINWNILT